VSYQFEIASTKQMLDVRLLACEEVVKTDDVMTIFDEPLTEMRPEKTGAAGD
jgi:hypothetical protein